jgi:hypothetical protein
MGVLLMKPTRQPARAKPLPPLGDRLSAAITAATGAQPCWACHQVRKGVNAFEVVVKKITTMKPLLLAALIALAPAARALDYSFSTNSFYAIDTVTNVYIGTNAPDATRDSAQIAWNKVNNNDNYLLRKQVDLNQRFTNFVSTNVVSSGGGSGAGGAVLWNWTVAGMYPNGNTGTGGGWTTTNLFIYPQ